MDRSKVLQHLLSLSYACGHVMVPAQDLRVLLSAYVPLGDNADAKIRLWAAVKAYELDELNVDEAAALADLTKVEFLQRLGELQVSMLSTDTLEQDVEVALPGD